MTTSDDKSAAEVVVKGTAPGSANRRGVLSLLVARLILVAGSVVLVTAIVLSHPEKNGIFMDQMTFLLQAVSLASDGDLVYGQEDRERFLQLGWGEEPLGLFLRRAGARYYYAKPVAYALLAAPFARLDPDHGPLLLNALLWVALLEITYRWLRRWLDPCVAALLSLTCWGLSGAVFYAFVVHPDLFIACLLGLCLLWTFGPFYPGRAVSKKRVPAPQIGTLRAVAVGMAGGVMVYSRLPLALFMCSILLFLWTRRQRRAALIAATLAAAGLAAFSLIHVCEDGHLTPYQGERIVVEKTDPYSPNHDADPLPSARTSGFFRPTELSGKVIDHVHHLAGYLPQFLLHYVAGRRVGLFPYLTPFLVLALLGILSLGNRKSRPMLWVLTPLALCILAGFYMTPATYHGGATAIGNRYAVQMTPAFVFCAGWIAIPVYSAWLALGFVCVSTLYFPGRALLQPATAIRDNYLIFQWNRFRHLPLEPELLWLNCDRVDCSSSIAPMTRIFRLSEPLPPQMGAGFWMGKNGYSRFAIMRLDEPGSPIQVRLASPNCRVTGTFVSGNTITPFSVDPNFTFTVVPVLAKPERVQYRHAAVYCWPLEIKVKSVEERWKEKGLPKGTGLFVQFAQPDPLYPSVAPEGSFEFDPSDQRAASLLLWGWWDATEANQVGRWAGNFPGSAFALPARVMDRPYGKVRIRARSPGGIQKAVFVPADASALNYTLGPAMTTQTLSLTAIPRSRFTDHLIRLQHTILQERTLTPAGAPPADLAVTGDYEGFTFYPPSRVAERQE